MDNQEITSHGISTRKRNYYMTMLKNSKELLSSYVGEEQFNITRMHFKKNSIFSSYVDFYGNIESENESRYISGRIYDYYNQVYISNATVVRIGVPVEENGIFNFAEGFNIHGMEDIIRVTRYDDSHCFLKISKDDFYNRSDSVVKLVRK